MADDVRGRSKRRGGKAAKSTPSHRQGSPTLSSSSSSSSYYFPNAMPEPRMMRPTKPKDKSPQEIIDEFWAKFTTKYPGRATTIIPKKNRPTKATVAPSPENGSTTHASYAEAAAVCRDKVEKIVRECRRVNRKYRDAHFDLEADLKMQRRDCLESLSNQPGVIVGGKFDPGSVKRVPDIFDKPEFYVDGPTATDVRQGRDGDCWLMAALCTLSNKPGLIEQVCVAQDPVVGVYGFVFFRDGAWVSEIIDDQLYLTKPDYDESHSERVLWEDRQRVNSEETYRKVYQSNSGALYFAQSSHPNETWLPLLEKCYAKAHGDYAAIEGGFGGEALEDLTGGVTSEVHTTDILDKDEFWSELLRANDEFLFGCATGVWNFGVSWGERKGIVERHAYSILKAREVDGQRLLLLRNPWGKTEWTGPWSDGSKEWTAEWMEKLGHRFGDDGAFWISFEDLLRKYQVFERTRLFGPEWRMAQEWTTLHVPWAQEYHDTYFSFALASAGPVVVVLSQLDDRYFRGLEGQYRFRLTFRVHKPGHESYIVRSDSLIGMSRSVNVELELDAGEYDVRVKVEARRLEGLLAPEDVLRDNARQRRDKLMRIGLAYDLAHSRGKIVETEAEKAAREAFEKRKRDKEREEMRKKYLEDRSNDYYLRVKDRRREQKHHARAKAKRSQKRAERRALAEARELAVRGPAGDFQPSDMPMPAGEGEPGPEGSQPEGMEKRVQIQVPGRDGEPAATVAPGVEGPAEGKTEEAAPAEGEAPEKGPDVPDVPKEPKEPGTGKESELAAAEEKPPTEDSAGDASKDGGPSPPAATPDVESEEKPKEGAEGPAAKDDKEGDGAGAPPNGEATTEDGPPRMEHDTVRDGDEPVAQDDERGPPSPPGMAVQRWHPQDCESEDELSDLPSLDTLSERELDITIGEPRRRRDGDDDGPPPPRPAEDPDEFEIDPWNAVAVVGLRVYFKPGDGCEKPEEGVRIKVVRPDPFEEEGDGDGDGEQQAEGSKGLDVDDSAKDASMNGTGEDRRKGIVPED